jgi:hypothetical protein
VLATSQASGRGLPYMTASSREVGRPTHGCNQTRREAKLLYELELLRGVGGGGGIDEPNHLPSLLHIAVAIVPVVLAAIAATAA